MTEHTRLRDSVELCEGPGTSGVTAGVAEPRDGSGAQAYPIQGLGLSSWLLHAGIIHGPRDAFPFLLLQLPLVILTWMLAWRWLSRRPRSADAILWMGIAFFVFYALFQLRLWMRAGATASLAQAVVSVAVAIGLVLYYRTLRRWGRR